MASTAFLGLAAVAAEKADIAQEWPFTPWDGSEAFRSWHSARGEHVQVRGSIPLALASACADYADAFQACVGAQLAIPLPGPAPITVAGSRRTATTTATRRRNSRPGSRSTMPASIGSISRRCSPSRRVVMAAMAGSRW